MSEFKVFTDSAADFLDSVAKENDITVVPFYVSINGQDYFKDGIEITRTELYNYLKQGNIPKTSLPSIDDYCTAFRPVLEEGKDILCFCLSQKLSGSYQSAVSAGNILLEEYPGRRIIIVDSKEATVSQGLLVLEAVKMRDDGMDIEAVEQKINQLIPYAAIFFTLDSLEHLQKGGRIGKGAALLGTILNIKPILKLSDGELFPAGKVRGRKKAIDTVANLLKEFMDEPEHYNISLVSLKDNNDEDEMEQALEKIGFKPNAPKFYIGATIGTHIGPTAIGIAAIKDYKYI